MCSVFGLLVVFVRLVLCVVFKWFVVIGLLVVLERFVVFVMFVVCC